MSNMFPTAFSPIKIKQATFKNRFFMAAHGTGYTVDGKVGDAAYDYYEERLKNDIALLVTEATEVVPKPGQKYNLLNASSDDCIPRFKKLADLCHSYDCRYFVQLFDFGRSHGKSGDGSKPVVLAPSALPDERFHIIPRALTTAEVGDMVGHFASAAYRAYRAGVDGVEILAGMSYLHAQFLDPRINFRDDQYGGSPENRRRFLAETLRAIRDATGPEFIVGIRIGGDEQDSDINFDNEAADTCVALESDGLIDYANACVGYTQSLAGSMKIVPPMFYGTGLSLDLAGELKRRLSIPVFAAGRVNQPQDAERALVDGQTDMVGMVRPLIADPEFIKKAADGRADEIRACIACNQACIGHRMEGFGVSCIQFPETGRERAFAIKEKVDTPRRVTVVGGGPAGMKAAVVAAQRGHAVTLYERGNQLGGQARLAQALPGRAEFGGLITNLENELERYGVDVRTSTNVTKESLLTEQPEVVIVATGALPRIPSGQFEGAHVVQAWDVIEAKANVGGQVVIADWACDWVGLGLAELLAENGCAVRLCVNGEMAGNALQQFVRHNWIGRLHALKVEIIPFMRLHGADEDTIYMQHVLSGEPVLIEDIDTLVLASGHDSKCDLYSELSGSGLDIRAIGDCLSPRTAEEAVLEGLKVGFEI